MKYNVIKSKKTFVYLALFGLFVACFAYLSDPSSSLRIYIREREIYGKCVKATSSEDKKTQELTRCEQWFKIDFPDETKVLFSGCFKQGQFLKIRFSRSSLEFVESQIQKLYETSILDSQPLTPRTWDERWKRKILGTMNHWPTQNIKNHKSARIIWKGQHEPEFLHIIEDLDHPDYIITYFHYIAWP